MAAKGTETKQKITQKILEVFPGSFTHEKEIRIPYTEDGAPGEIKITLTAAKNMVGDGAAVPVQEESITSGPAEQIPTEPTEEEKERLAFLLNELGL